MPTKPSNWSRDELLAAFNLYSRTPFGRMHSRNPDIFSLANRIGRSPSAVAMKLVNFASLDPVERARHVSGLTNVSRGDRELWEAFLANPEAVAYESELASARLAGAAAAQPAPALPDEDQLHIPQGGTEATRLVRTRLVQGFFRSAVLTSYGYRCAFCSLAIPELLSASHIIPWSVSVERRADPRNGLSLCALHDRAFDRGLTAVGEDFRILLSRAIRDGDASPVFVVALRDIEGAPITPPLRFAPDADALAYHRRYIFKP